MSSSFTQTVLQACPKCGNVIRGEIHLIVNVTKQPDLVNKIINGTLHNATCPQCGHVLNVDAPLLVFHPKEEPHILFSPADGSSEEIDQQHAMQLIEELKHSLGWGWKRKWLQDGLPVVIRQDLPAVFGGLPVKKVHEPARPVNRDVQKVHGDGLERYLRSKLIELLDTQDLNAKLRLLQVTPELLGTEAERLLQGMLEKTREHQDFAAGEYIQEHIKLLANWRTGGLEAISPKPNGSQSMKEEIPPGALNILEEVYRLTRRSEMPRRIELCRQILKLLSRKKQPRLRAEVENELANSLLQTPLGDQAQNVDEAIFCLEQALKTYTRTIDSERWAIVQNNLAGAYQKRIQGDHGENLEEAISHYHQALEVFTREYDPQRWAGIQNNLAAVYRERVRGERADNIEQAIRYHQSALEARTRGTFPEDWAMTQQNLATAYCSRIKGNRAENIEQAIQHYQLALEVRTRQANPEGWAMTQSSLAEAYRKRIQGSREENILNAIQCCHLALEVRTFEGDPRRWAESQGNLALALLDRTRFLPEAERAANLRQVIQRFEKVVDVFTRSANPVLWARTHNNLMDANCRLASFLVDEERENTNEKAIQHGRRALEIFTRQADPEHWALILNNLACCYAEQVGGQRSENIERAIQYHQQVLEVYTRETFPEDWARVQFNLAADYKKRLVDTHQRNLEQAMAHCQQALQIHTPRTNPVECRLSARTLGDLAFEARNWEMATDAYVQALDAQDVLMQTSFSRSNKKAELREVEGIAAQAAYALAQIGEMERAVETLEQGRAQLMRETLEHQRIDLEQLTVLGFKGLTEEYAQAIRNYEEVRVRGTGAAVLPEKWLAEIDAAMTQLNTAVSAIRNEAGEIYPQYRYFLKSLPFSEIQKQAMGGSLVYLSATSAGGMALIVTDTGVQYIPLPLLTRDALDKRIWKPAKNEEQRINDHLRDGVVTREDIQAARSGYLSIYRMWNWMPFLVKTTDEVKRALLDAWKDTLDEITRWLWTAMMDPLISAVRQQRDSVALIPTGQLAVLPLHAAWCEDETCPTKRHYVLDELNITFAPSAHALWQASLTCDRPVAHLLLVDNPDGSLVYAGEEAHAALDVFEQTTHLHGSAATKEAVKENIREAHVIHFTTHGRADWKYPEQTHLMLANGTLSVQDFFSLDLDLARLAILSACETGIPGMEVIEEVVGLPAGVMQAGVPGVIGSLWAVNDMSTAMLMARFYQLWRKESLAPPEALRQAQIWLRDSTTEQKKQLFKCAVEQDGSSMSGIAARAFYQHIGWDDPQARAFAAPYHWAAFTYTGL